LDFEEFSEEELRGHWNKKQSLKENSAKVE
jgi:hypothetical protein